MNWFGNCWWAAPVFCLLACCGEGTEGDEILQTTYYGYAKGATEALDAIRVEEPLLLEEQAEITKVTLTKISDLNISLN